MAEGLGEREGGSAATTAAAGQPGTKLPPGMVLGKDGKPCRSCTSGASFKAWASQQTKSPLKANSNAATTAGAAAAAAAAAASLSPSNDCPADVETLGRSSWTLLHSIAATYPTAPTSTEQADLKGFIRLFSKLYPCWVCAEDFQQYMQKEAVRTGSRDEFGTWLCEAHNEVNRKLGKPTFDCSRWQERWRTGWKDGRCD